MRVKQGRGKGGGRREGEKRVISKLLVDSKQGSPADREKIFPVDPSFFRVKINFAGIFDLRAALARLRHRTG